MPARRSRAVVTPLAAALPYWVGSASVTGAPTARPVTVTNPTAQGDTILVICGFSVSGLSGSAVTDSRGNIYTQDYTFTTTLPYFQAYRSAGATGGSGGGKTAALLAGDTITVTTPATTGQMTASVSAVTAGAQDVVPVGAIISAATTGGVSITPAAAGDLIICGDLNQATASAIAATAPFAILDSRQPGSGSVWLSFAYSQLAAGAGAGVAQTQTFTWTGSSNWRGVAWALAGQVTGTGAVAAKKARLAGSGTYTPPTTGTGAISAKKAKLAGAGTYTPPVTGTGAIAAKKAALAGAGTYTPPIAPVTGTGAIAAKKPQLAGAGTYTPPSSGVTGTGAIAAKKAALAGVGVYTPPPVAVPLYVPGPDLLPITWAGMSLNDGDRGDGLVTVVTNVDGWYGSPALAGGDLARQLTDGAIFGFKTLGPRVVTVTGSVAADDETGRGALNQFARDLAALAAQPEPADLAIAEDQGAGDGSVSMLSASVRADSGQLSVAWTGRLFFSYQVELTAADPRLYDASWQTLNVTPAPAGGVTGRVYPWRPVRAYASANVANAARLTNDGSAPAPVWLTYYGDLSESRLSDGTSTIHVAPLGAGQQLVVNTETLNAVAPGGASRASYLLAGTTPLLIPAESTATWSLYGTGGGHVTLSWRGVFA